MNPKAKTVPMTGKHEKIKTSRQLVLLRTAAALILVPALSLTLVTCRGSGTGPAGIAKGYVYPEDPPGELQAALKKAAADNNLPMTVSGVEYFTSGDVDQAAFMVVFAGGANVCAITFNVKYTLSDYSLSLDGNANPSFVMAFKDPENTDDLKSLLALVLRCLSPELSAEEARRLAQNQDATISVDGYSQPLDIGGYQVTTRATNPQPFISTKDFESCLGVEVTALKQIWGNADVRSSKEMRDAGDFLALSGGDDGTGESVHADFIIKNVWHHEEWVHGEYWTEVEVESMDGSQYSLRLETMLMTSEYEFGVGQKYTVFVDTGSVYGAQIVYAVQQSEVSSPNRRGVPQETDYPNPDEDNSKRRMEPEGDGDVRIVSFELVSHGIEDACVKEGYGVGASQWPRDPGRDNYVFTGWFDKPDGTGKPFTKDTPVYQDTALYAGWKYEGSGGAWPRAHFGRVLGIEEGAVVIIGKEINVTAAGYNMELETPEDQRFRWQPVTWRLSDGTAGSFSGETPFEATVVVSGAGVQRLFITYVEWIFDGAGWQATGQSREVEEVTFLGIHPRSSKSRALQ